MTGIGRDDNHAVGITIPLKNVYKTINGKFIGNVKNAKVVALNPAVRTLAVAA